MKLIKESCVETYEEAIMAENRGADRIELCSRLDLEGLTPPKDLIEKLVSVLTIPIKVMIRPRSGDFFYNIYDIFQMQNSIDDIKALGVFGVVFGVLNYNRTINIEAVNDLVSASIGLNITFHKALDETINVLEQYKNLDQNTKINSVLTSGGGNTALLGYKNLKQMLKISKGRKKIIIAGSVTHFNLLEIHNLIGGTEYHGKSIIDIS